MSATDRKEDNNEPGSSPVRQPVRMAARTRRRGGGRGRGGGNAVYSSIPSKQAAIAACVGPFKSSQQGGRTPEQAHLSWTFLLSSCGWSLASRACQSVCLSVCHSATVSSEQASERANDWLVSFLLSLYVCVCERVYMLLRCVVRLEPIGRGTLDSPFDTARRTRGEQHRERWKRSKVST